MAYICMHACIYACYMYVRIAYIGWALNTGGFLGPIAHNCTWRNVTKFGVRELYAVSISKKKESARSHH